MKIEFELPGLPPCTNGSHGHWSTKAKSNRTWRAASRLVAIAFRPVKPFEKCAVTFVRCSTSEPDFDNLVISGKPIIDGLKDAGIIVDDKSSCIVERTYSWEPAKRGQGRVKVTIEERV